MTDTAIGFALVGIGMLVVLGVVFVVFSRGGPAEDRPSPPRGVHLPNPSFLPVIISAGFALLGSGLAFRADGEVANLFLAIPGVLVLVLGIVFWARAAGTEWHDTEHGPHGDGASH